MAGEFVMGMHGKLKYAGERLAGMYPHQQVKVAEKAGANIFGPVVNTNSNKSFAWNICQSRNHDQGLLVWPRRSRFTH